jgi:hypothetical protein
MDMKVRSKNVWFILALLWVLIPFSARCEDPSTSIYGVLRRLIIETPGTATSIQEELVLIPPQGKALPLTLTNEIRSQLNKYVNSTVEIVSPDIKSKTKQAGASVVVSAF